MEVEARDRLARPFLQPDERQGLGGSLPRLSLADDSVPAPNIAPRTAFSSTVIEPKGNGRCIAIAIPLRLTRCAVRPSILAPSSRMLPRVGRSSPTITFSSVLLPAPFGPTTATMSPSSIPNVTPSTAGSPPKRFVMPSTSRSRLGLRGYDGGR